MAYVNIYTTDYVSKLNSINDSQNLLVYTTTSGGSQPPVIEKTHTNFFEFVLATNERKVLTFITILDASHINNITGNDRSLLKKAYISNDCTIIDTDCFLGCTNLEYVSYTNDNSGANIALTTIKQNSFSGCINLDECKLFDISNSITNIEDNAFKNCNKLFEVQLENTQIQTLGASVFENCLNLVTIHFPLTLNNIGTNCFKNTSLVNIFFLNTLPTTLGTNIFYNISHNAACYYNSSYINGTNLNVLQNLFDNAGIDVVFIDVSTNPNSLINANVGGFYNITYNNVDVNVIQQTIQIIDSLIVKSMVSTPYNIDIDYDQALSGTDILGYADWSVNEIKLNPDNIGNTTSLNGIANYNQVSVVLFHEILHMFGFGVGTLWESFVNFNEALNYHFTGKNAVHQYNKLIKNNGFYRKLPYLTIEDSGNFGTLGSHTEEGIFFNTVSSTSLNNGEPYTYTIPQMRADSNGNVYPSVPSEIMSGYLGAENYITRQCCGVLQDLEFTINYNSDYVYKDTVLFSPNVSYGSSNLSSISSLSNVNTFKFKCGCCPDISNNIKSTIVKF